MADEEMRPPPRRSQLSTNADFRKLLETPRADRFPSEKKPPRPKKPAPEGQKPKRKPQRPKQEAEDGEDDGPGYRDRAEERRKGINPDYERVSSDLATIIGGPLNTDLGGISVEDSKFLGGDVDHTHLVKGLDYALLQKVRGEMTKEEEQEKAQQDTRKSALEPEIVKFKGPAARALFNAVFSRRRIGVADAFAPGRTAFVFELEDADAPDVPTTLRRSKADCPPVPETIRGGMDASVLERMVKIMSYMRGSSGKPGRLKKKDKLRMLQMLEGANGGGAAKPKPAEPEQPAGPADADADIFGDAGRDYVPELPQARAGAGQPAARSDQGVPPPPPPLPPPAGPAPPPAGPVGPARPSGGYDAAAAALAAYGDGGDEPQPPPPADEEDMELDRLAGLAPPPPPPADGAPLSRRERREARKAAEAKEAKEAIPRDGEDAYEELYPEYGGFGGGLVDSDEEDLTHMDKRDAKSRLDFETQEQWEKHKAKQEMMPKAAFQFGVKTSDGRRGHRQLGKAVEQKEQKEYKAIKNLLKQDHGDKYAAAFRAPSREAKEGGGGPAKKRRI